jgi:orotate phosphoribosyltransferase
VNPAEALEVLERRGAVRNGHFKLSSGRHSDIFVQKFRVFEDAKLTQAFGDAIAARFHGDFDCVASPAIGAIVLGFAVALSAQKRFLFAERTDDRLEFRRGFEVAPRERTLIVEDVVTTGGSAREVVDLVRAAGGEPVGIGALIDRADPARGELGVQLDALVRLEVDSWAPEDCPLCSSGAPVEDPGSRRLG